MVVNIFYNQDVTANNIAVTSFRDPLLPEEADVSDNVSSFVFGFGGACDGFSLEPVDAFLESGVASAIFGEDDW